MTTFTNGPAEGLKLLLRRAPLFIRIVVDQGGEVDALDDPGDETRPSEVPYTYRRSSRPLPVYVSDRGPRGNRTGGQFMSADYALHEIQPDRGVMTDNARWQEWWLAWAAGSAGGEVTWKNVDYTVMFTKSMQLDCCYGQTGKIAVTFEDPTAMIEVVDAVRAGKVPRRAGITLAMHGELYSFTVAAETLVINGLKLPAVEKADSPRVLFEERITLLRMFCTGFDSLYDAFLVCRLNRSWADLIARIQKWLAAKVRAA